MHTKGFYLTECWLHLRVTSTRPNVEMVENRKAYNRLQKTKGDCSGAAGAVYTVFQKTTRYSIAHNLGKC